MAEALDGSRAAGRCLDSQSSLADLRRARANVEGVLTGTSVHVGAASPARSPLSSCGCRGRCPCQAHASPSQDAGRGLGLGLGRQPPDFMILPGTNLLRVKGKEAWGRCRGEDVAEVSGAWGPSLCGPGGPECPAGAQPDRGRPCGQALTLWADRCPGPSTSTGG